MDDKKTKFNFTPIVLLIFSVMILALRTWFLLNAIEPSTGLYEYGNNSFLLFDIALILSLAVIAASCIFSPKRKVLEQVKKSYYSVVTSSFCGFMLLCVLSIDVISILTKKTSFGILSALQIIFCAISVLYFFLICTDKKNVNSTLFTFISICPAAFTAVRLIEYFLDTKTIINASQRHLMILAMCSFMLFLLFDARNLLSLYKTEKSARKCHVQYMISACFTFFFVFVCVIPHLLLSAFWLITPEMHYAYYFLDISLGFFAMSRLVETNLKVQKSSN